jgi:Peptidase_C39 like family
MTTTARLTAVFTAAAIASMVGFAGAAHATPSPPGGMHGDPAAAAPYWRLQRADLDCGEMAVADVIGQITGNQPSEDEIDSAAENIPSGSHGGPIYAPADRTSNHDLAVLLAHYGIQSDPITTNLDVLERALDQGRKVIAGVNSKTIWNRAGDRSVENHFVVVTGIDTQDRIVHLNDSGVRGGRDEQVSIETFEQSWNTSDNFAVITK